MAGHGRAPKPIGQRRNRHEPQRGEWVDLSPLSKPLLPAAQRNWTARVKRLWKAWREDPVTSQYGPSDLVAIWELADQFERLAPGEQRLRMDGLGLTPKGKRDLRWRTPAEVQTIAKQGELADVRRLRVVTPDAVAG